MTVILSLSLKIYKHQLPFESRKHGYYLRSDKKYYETEITVIYKSNFR